MSLSSNSFYTYKSTFIEIPYIRRYMCQYLQNMLLSWLVGNITIISPSGNSLIAITIYRGLDLLRGRSKRYERRSISCLFWRTAAPRSDSRNKRLKSVYPLPQAFLLPSQDPFSPRICLKTRFPFSSRARTVLELEKFYYCPEDITARQQT